jgi:hypothetical protein
VGFFWAIRVVLEAGDVANLVEKLSGWCLYGDWIG